MPKKYGGKQWSKSTKIYRFSYLRERIIKNNLDKDFSGKYKTVEDH